YRAGWPSASTAVDAPYYHTVADTPDKVDLPRLCATVDAFDALLDELPEASEPDPSLWQGHADGRGDLVVRVTDTHGAPRADARVEVTVFKDGFFPVATQQGTTDRQGHFRTAIPPGSFVHVTAGLSYPLAEAIFGL